MAFKFGKGGEAMKGFTVKQHERVALELYHMRNRLLGLVCCMSRSYRLNGKELRMTKNVLDKLDILRSELDCAFCREVDAAGVYDSKTHKVSGLEYPYMYPYYPARFIKNEIEPEPPALGKKNGFTVEQHKRVGSELYQIWRRLSNLHCCISRAYTQSGKESRMAGSVCDKLETLRSLLDDAFCVEHPKDFDAVVYYPHCDVHVDPMNLTYEEVDEEALEEERAKLLRKGMVK